MQCSLLAVFVFVFCIYICIFSSLYFPYELLLQCSGAAFRAARWLPNTDRGPWAGQHRPTILLHQGGLLPYQQAFTHHTSGRGRPTTIPTNRLLPTICTRPPLDSHHIISPVHQSAPHQIYSSKHISAHQ